ncbi:MAG: type II glyceraldehyde-3-phosphate dehydrogenase [Nitrososphaerota archaeon]|nr:type II glyceraldehyde-3-phosphate dehydrogenase [Nitrososphaerota archaeon]MDG6939688.1 type II glyceraldehyde-3-phosphate dehydrogenase [Nitrososphaerota archaeon]
MVRVSVNGYGTIGRRIADAVKLQPDMELAGMVKRTPDYWAFLAMQKGIPIFCPDPAARTRLERAGVKVEGLLEDLFARSDIVVDCSPEKGEENKPLYESAGMKAVFQGGEVHSIAGVSFVAQCNYLEAVGRQYVRVVSCNTTALARVLKTLDDAVGVEKGIATLVRRATDPEDCAKGPIDSVVPDPVELPSHHADDVRTVMPGMDLTTMAVKVPTTHMHLHALALKVKEPDAGKAVSALLGAPRILLFESKKGYRSTANMINYAREIGRPRGDLYEVGVWKESVKVEGDWLYLFMGVHQESIVVPENIDCVRAMTGEEDASRSIQMTNKTLGMVK